MKMYPNLVLPAGALLLLCAVRGLASETDGVTHNPFARPERVVEPQVAAGQITAGAPMFRLRATMAAGEDSLVNIDGKIVAIGDVFLGFRLVAVGEGTAVFVRNGVRYPVAVSRLGGDQG